VKLEDVILIDIRADQPAATAVPVGTLFCVTDEGDIVERSNGTTWDAYSPTGGGAGEPFPIQIVIDGAGSAITTGNKGYARSVKAGTITKVTVLSIDGTGPATSGSIVVDIWKDTYANYPPTVADSITASAKPTLSSAIKSEDSTLTGWTTAVAAGDCFGFNVDSAATVTKVLVLLEVTP
jgi:hypothetical protein